jgi:hypothetical protein
LSHIPPRDSALAYEVHGADVVAWTPEMEQLSQIKYQAQVANWQRGGGKGKRPKPDRRPGRDKVIRIGKTDRDPRQVRALLDSYSYRPPEETSPDGE